MKSKIYNLLTWVILALLVGSVIAKFAGFAAAQQAMWLTAAALIVVWLLLRLKK